MRAGAPFLAIHTPKGRSLGLASTPASRGGLPRSSACSLRSLRVLRVDRFGPAAAKQQFRTRAPAALPQRPQERLDLTLLLRAQPQRLELTVPRRRRRCAVIVLDHLGQ